MKSTLFLSCCIHIVFQVSCHNSSENCLLDHHTERIQLGFVVDVTNTNKLFMEFVFYNVFKKLIPALNEIHPETEIALTAFANWPLRAFKPSEPESFEEKCYMFLQGFTSDFDVLQNVAKKYPQHGGRPGGTGKFEENSLHAVSFALADNKMGWVRSPFDAANKRVHRFILMLTDVYTLWELPYPGDRKPFRGDGSDTCATTLPLKEEKVGEILLKNQVKVIGVYTNDVNTGYVNEYDKFFDKYDTQHCYTVLPAWREGYDIESTEKKVLSTIVDCVKHQLECEYEDPSPYNTLGI